MSKEIDYDKHEKIFNSLPIGTVIKSRNDYWVKPYQDDTMHIYGDYINLKTGTFKNWTWLLDFEIVTITYSK